MKLRMKTRWGIMVFTLVFGMFLAGCGGSDPGSLVSHHHHFHGHDESGDRYELEVISSDQYPQNFQDGNPYIMQIINSQGATAGRSTGKVRSFSDGILTLVHQSGVVFNVHVTVFITLIPNDFPLDNDTTRRWPGPLTRERPNQSDGITHADIIGTWSGTNGVADWGYEHTFTLTLNTDSTFSLRYIMQRFIAGVSEPFVDEIRTYRITYSGTYTVLGNTINLFADRLNTRPTAVIFTGVISDDAINMRIFNHQPTFTR